MSIVCPLLVNRRIAYQTCCECDAMKSRNQEDSAEHACHAATTSTPPTKTRRHEDFLCTGFLRALRAFVGALRPLLALQVSALLRQRAGFGELRAGCVGEMPGGEEILRRLHRDRALAGLLRRSGEADERRRAAGSSGERGLELLRRPGG